MLCDPSPPLYRSGIKAEVVFELACYPFRAKSWMLQSARPLLPVSPYVLTSIIYIYYLYYHPVSF